MAANFKITGEIVDIKDEVQVTDRFSKRELWVEIPGSRGPQTLSFEVANQACSKLDEFSIGEKVDITFSLRGRVWQDKCYSSLHASEITLVGNRKEKKDIPKQKKTPGPRKEWTPPENNEWMEPSGKEAVDDLPF